MARGVVCGIAGAVMLCAAQTSHAARVAFPDDTGEFEILHVRDRTDADNRIGVQLADRGAALVVRDSVPLDVGEGCEPVGESRFRARCKLGRGEDPFGGPSVVVVVTRAGRGDDHFTLRGRSRYRKRFMFAFTDLGRGADRLRGGEGPESVIPGPGRDRIELGFGADQVLASSERDGTDTIEGEGRDAILYFRRQTPVTVDLPGGVAGAPGEADRISDIRFAIGGKAADRLLGGGARNALAGGAGEDLLLGRGGEDELDGGRDVDEYSAGGGRDFVFAADRTSESVDCGAGPDFAFVDGDDVLASCEDAETVGPVPFPRVSPFAARASTLPEQGLRRTLRRHLGPAAK